MYCYHFLVCGFSIATDNVYYPPSENGLIIAWGVHKTNTLYRVWARQMTQIGIKEQPINWIVHVQRGDIISFVKV